MPLKEISDAQQISLKYLEQIVTPLTKAGLVLSVRGAQGGYRLARPGYRDHCRRDPACGGRRADGYPLPGLQPVSAPAGASATRWVSGAG